jgi:glyoxylase-like metal-dependent hydrolase (beta-lactamase superfamily II)
MSDLYLKQLAVGPMANFAYLIGSKSAKQCFAVDPAWEIDAIVDAAAADDMQITGALVSHFHPDHCGGHLWGHDIQGVAELIGKQPVPVYAHRDEVAGILHVTGLSKTDLKPVRGGDKLALGGVEVTMLHTPGHTPGSTCFLCQNTLISGDTLFLTGCGRTDLPGGNAEQLYESLNGTLAKLPAQTMLYPGHHYDPAEAATLEVVRKNNPYLKPGSLAEWKRLFGS